jgi:ketosteroid isomerase-like protein
VSTENMETVTRALEAASQDPEALFSILDERVEWDTSGGALPDTKARYHGPDGVREFFRRWLGPFEDFGYEVEEVIDADEAVIVLLHQWGSGRGSGIRVDSRFWQVWTLREGKVVRFQHFPEKTRALKAASG